ncbi:hypothetical protein DEIPH_ctg051orf0012 [Deinococcus phoenicis]|uniref:Methyltransferase type 11 domain-containing protein n=1 Tax=Deinococcus phoenicis TaxID=1476583 RepID=A0A016QMM1_9DEIO|nr:hypothetical protein [Deinococcus phoenicis]EYB67107.1 hypothetical protein DEIPH_ctg051orf0012 [Deinococcus phoenicis]
MKIMLGAGEQRWAGWTPTQREELDLTDPAAFARFFEGARADAFLCEHVWEHLTPQQGLAAARLVLAYLRPGGLLRVAVPDGHHPNPAYRARVAVNGPGPAQDHRVLYTLESFVPVFEHAGFAVTPLEWWDAAGVFHAADWSPADGPIYRSSLLDHRNADWRAGRGRPGFTSLILDAQRP